MMDRLNEMLRQQVEAEMRRTQQITYGVPPLVPDPVATDALADYKKPMPEAKDVHGRVDAGWIYGELLGLLSFAPELLHEKIASLAWDVLDEVAADAEEASPEFKAAILAALHDDGPTRIIEPGPEARGISQDEASDVD